MIALFLQITREPVSPLLGPVFCKKIFSEMEPVGIHDSDKE